MRPDNTERDSPRGEPSPSIWTQPIESVIDDQNRPLASTAMIRDPRSAIRRSRSMPI